MSFSRAWLSSLSWKSKAKGALRGSVLKSTYRSEGYHTSVTHEAQKKIIGCDTWWYDHVQDLPKPTRRLFEQHSGLATHEVLPHIESLRDRAFKIFPYPCIGQYRFLNLSLSQHFLYDEVLGRLRATPQLDQPEETFLDVGCCLGQDLRKLAYDGVPSTRLYGLDRDARFIGLGYELFRDRHRFGAHFANADLMAQTVDTNPALFSTVLSDPGRNPSYMVSATSTDPLSSLSSPDKVSPSIPPTALLPLSTLSPPSPRAPSIILANSFFHLYSLSEQKLLAHRLLSILRPTKGALLLGRQVGSAVAGEYPSISDSPTATRFAHDKESFHAFWKEIARETGDDCAFRVEVVMDTEELGKDRNRGQRWAEENIRRMRFGVWRM